MRCAEAVALIRKHNPISDGLVLALDEHSLPVVAVASPFVERQSEGECTRVGEFGAHPFRQSLQDRVAVL